MLFLMFDVHAMMGLFVVVSEPVSDEQNGAQCSATAAAHTHTQVLSTASKTDRIGQGFLFFCLAPGYSLLVNK